MGRRAEGWRLRGEPDGIKTVRFRVAGKRHELSTGERDPARARAEAAKLYAEAVSGRRSLTQRGPVQPAAPMFAEWLAAIETTIAESYGSNPASTSRIWEPANAENCAAGDAQKCAGNTVAPVRVGDAPPELIGLAKALTHLAADPLWSWGLGC